MIIKQKTTLFLLTLGVAIGLASATTIVLPGDTVFAQIDDESGDDGGGGAAGSTDTDPCSTVPPGWGKTLKACQDAVDRGDDPCQAIFDILEADGNDAAQERKDACENAGSATSDSSEPSFNHEDKGNCEEGEKCCGKVQTSIISGAVCDEGDAGGTIFNLLKEVLKIMTAGIGIAAVGGIGYGALLYTTAESKPEQTKKAIGIITNVVIGLVAYALMFLLLNFIIPGGVFG